jgi:hypothetical protein
MFLLPVGFSCLATTAFARYRFDFWTTENGPANNWIMAIHGTREGYLWLTTILEGKCSGACEKPRLQKWWACAAR